MKYKVLAHVRAIREEIGASRRDPEITRIRETPDTLHIECEDRADKSIVIGTGGWVVGKLSQALGKKTVTVSSRVDAIRFTSRLVRTRRDIISLPETDVSSTLLGILNGGRPYPLPCAIIGEECLWMCGMMERRGCRPHLLHTGFVDPHIRKAYAATSFESVDAPATPYGERCEALQARALSYCGDTGCPLVLGPFGYGVRQEGSVTLADPSILFSFTTWDRQAFEKRRFRPHLFNISDDNRSYLVRYTLDEVWEGRCEPSEAARTLYDHWPNGGWAYTGDEAHPNELGRAYGRRNAIRRARHHSHLVATALSSYGTNHVPDTGLTALVAWSGGVDSTACIPLCKSVGLMPTAATVAMPHILIRGMYEKAESLGVPLAVLPEPVGLSDIAGKASQGAIHPCGRCHGAIGQAIIAYARKEGYDIVVFGDMLSVGAQAIAEDNCLIILNLPAALGLSKKDLEQIAQMRADTSFGCPMLAKSHTEHPHTRRISLQRVMRELRGQAITLSFAASLANSIMGCGHEAHDDNVFID